MSVSLAKAWVESSFENPAPGADAIRTFEKAEHDRVPVTLLIGRGLTKRRRAYIARWDGLELVVNQLSKEQQLGWNLKPLEMVTRLDFPNTLLPIVATSPEISISDVHVETELAHNGWEPIGGTCQFKHEERPQWSNGTCALQIQYFHPTLRAQILGMWYAEGPLGAKEGTLRFRFSPLYSLENKIEGLKGPLAIFLQMFTAENWQARKGCRKISNVTSSLINLK